MTTATRQRSAPVRSPTLLLHRPARSRPAVCLVTGCRCFWNTDEGASVDHGRHHQHPTPGSGTRRSATASRHGPGATPRTCSPNRSARSASSMVLQEALSPGLRDDDIDLGALASYDEFENPDAPDLFKMFGGYVYNPLTLTRILGARDAGGVAGDDLQGVLRRARRSAALRRAALHASLVDQARLGESMAWAMSTPVPSRAGRLPGPRPPPARAPPGPHIAHRFGADRPLLPDDPLPPADSLENAMRVSSVGSPGLGVLRATWSSASATRRCRFACWPASTSTRRRRRTPCGTPVVAAARPLRSVPPSTPALMRSFTV